MKSIAKFGKLLKLDFPDISTFTAIELHKFICFFLENYCLRGCVISGVLAGWTMSYVDVFRRNHRINGPQDFRKAPIGFSLSIDLEMPQSI